MRSQNRPYLSQVDEIRGYAALLVLFFHCLIVGHWKQGHESWILVNNPLEAFVIEGHSGVALFMVLSGFILSLGIWNRPFQYWGFIHNRVIRIFPLLTVLAVSAIYSSHEITLAQVIAPFAMLQNVMPIALNDPSHLLGVAWTISIEFQFYLIAPFLFLFIDRQGVLSFAIPLMLFLFLLRMFISVSNGSDQTFLWQFPAFTILGHINQFIFGIIVAKIWPEITRQSVRRGHALGVTSLLFGLSGMIALSYIINVQGGQQVWHWWRIAVPELERAFWSAFIAGYIFLNPLRRLPGCQACASRLGVISFSIYLLHWPIFLGVFAALPHLGMRIPVSLWGLAIFSFCIIFPLVVSSSTLSYWTIERPFLNLRVRYMK